LSSERSTSWPSASTASRLQRLEFSGRLRISLRVEHHLFDGDLSFLHALDRGEPFHHDAFLERLFDLEVVRGHAIARAAIDDDGFGRAKPFGGARDIERGVAAAIDGDAPAEQRLVLAFH
jgi:hypothetical protein